MPTSYPHPQTKAHEILGFIQKNPGTTRNAIITSLGFNPSIVRRYVQVLIEHRLVQDEPTQQGWHRYTAIDSNEAIPGVYQMELELR